MSSRALCAPWQRETRNFNPLVGVPSPTAIPTWLCGKAYPEVELSSPAKGPMTFPRGMAVSKPLDFQSKALEGATEVKQVATKQNRPMLLLPVPLRAEKSGLLPAVCFLCCLESSDE